MGVRVCPEGIMCCGGSANPPCEFMKENVVGYQPITKKPQHAITHRNLLWGLYVRVLDGDVLWESWLWGAYRRRKLVVPRAALSAGDRAAFAAIGGPLTVNGTTYDPVAHPPVDAEGEGEVFEQLYLGKRRPRRTSVPGAGKPRRS